MTLQILVFILFTCVPLNRANEIKKPKKPIDRREVDVIYSPYDGKGENGNKSSAVLSVNLEDLTDFTVCFAAMVDGLVDTPGHFADIATFWHILASFFVPEQVGLEIPFEEGSFAPYQWIHTCFSVNRVKGDATIVVNGIEKSKGKIFFLDKLRFLKVTLENTGMGISVIGFNMFASALTTELMEKMTKAESTECGKPGDFLSWDTAFKNWTLKGGARRERIKGPCQKESSLVIFSEPMSFPSGRACMWFCQNLGGHAPSVRTRENWDNLTKELDLLITDWSQHYQFWLAIRLGVKNKGDKWRDPYTGLPLDDYYKKELYNDTGKNDGAKSVYMSFEEKNQTWQWSLDIHGETSKTKCLCEKSALQLRGLCKNSPLRGKNEERGLQYFPRQCTKLSCKNTNDEESFLAGGISTKIAIDKGEWKLTHAKDDLFAVSEAPEGSYPLGKHAWNFYNDECYNGSYKAELKLTGCKDDEFTCDDGQCVDMKQRCDQTPQCEDDSDEKGCQLILLNEGYNQIVPPFTTGNCVEHEIVPAKINISIKLFNILSIDEVDNTIDLKFEIMLEWFDHRHTYNNLKEHRSFLNALNETDLDRIWLPIIFYDNTDQYKRTQRSWNGEWITNVMVSRKGNFTRSDILSFS